MSTTIEFYSVTLPGKEIADLSIKSLFDFLGSFPVADFSLHLLLPDDLDMLCQSLHGQNPVISTAFGDQLVKTLWFDGQSALLSLISSQFVIALAKMTNIQIEQAGIAWASIFEKSEAVREAPTFRALLRLHEVAKDAVANNRSLVVWLVY